MRRQRRRGAPAVPRDNRSVLSERALERRLKRHLMKERHAYFVPCVPGFEDVLEAEVAPLPGAEELERTRGGVSFTGPLDLVYHANLHLASGQRVLLRVGTYLAQSFTMLYDHLRRIHWELYLGFQPTYSVRVATSASRLDMQSRIEQTLDDAIRARIEPLGLRPESDPNAVIGIHLRLYRDRCTVSIDTSGAHLHRRGTRTHVGEAPLRETLAAACLLAADVRGARVVVDPFCGSGAIVLEAARILAGAPAGARRAFAFASMPFFQRSKWERFRLEALDAADAADAADAEVHGGDGAGSDAAAADEATAAADEAAAARVVASDLDEAVLTALRSNLTRSNRAQGDGREAGPAAHDAQGQPMPERGVPVEIEVADATTRSYPPLDEASRGLIAANLPYGRRILSPRQADDLAARFSAALVARAAGWEIALVTQHPEHFVRAPFRVVRRTDFRNGGLHVTFVHAAIPRNPSHR